MQERPMEWQTVEKRPEDLEAEAEAGEYNAAMVQAVVEGMTCRVCGEVLARWARNLGICGTCMGALDQTGGGVPQPQYRKPRA